MNLQPSREYFGATVGRRSRGRAMQICFLVGAILGSLISVVRPVMASGPTPDEQALDAFANQYAGVCKTGNFSCMNHYAVVGVYALVGYYDGKHRAGMFVAKKISGNWTVLSHGGGAIDQNDLLQIAPGMTNATAKSLETIAYPLWTCC